MEQEQQVVNNATLMALATIIANQNEIRIMLVQLLSNGNGDLAANLLSGSLARSQAEIPKLLEKMIK